MEKVLAGYVGRLAPSPTGALHLGNVRTFMIAYLRARSLGGKVILRIEDLDHPRDKPGAAREAVEDLKWLGFDWDEEYVQSERKDIYREALSLLPAYPCVCTRRDVENAQSAPHAGEQLHYPGICRGRFSSWREAAEFCGEGRLPCWRYRVDEGTVVSFTDVFAGDYSQNVSSVLGDFPIARDEGGAGYTLAVVVDDLLSGVTEVVRGDDLLPATPAQILIAEKLLPWVKSKSSNGAKIPEYCHVPLVVGPDGKRLAKRHGDTRVASYRASGVTPEAVIGRLAASCGWCDGGKISLRELFEEFSLGAIPHEPFIMI
ncbi:MAG: tRNA glutamyl-Q(34) synthetase GluQRS [Kiritimatiellae bacterium]|nr:tRNA glutamyl-Q(34) synthetase GluQRS [Kiritimatiellia bacterium]